MKNTHPGTIVVLPGSKWQVPLVQKLSKDGYRVLTVNPFEDSPAFEFADGHLQADIFDIDAVAAYCKAEKATAILSDECDIAMPAIATLGERLGLHALSPESARLFTDKHRMRQFCEEHGFANPEYQVCKCAEEAESFMKAMSGSKIVLKPLDANSSRGVSIIGTASEVPDAFTYAMEYSKIEKAVLAERFVEGREFTVDGIKTPSGHTSLAISKKAHYEHNESIACELYFSHHDPDYDYDALRTTNDALMDATPLEFGLTHCEYKYENGKFYLIEMAARGGGNLISSHIVPFLSGIDNYNYLIDASLHGPSNASFTIPDSSSENCAVLRFFDSPTPKGTVEAIEGKGFLESCKGILAHGFNFDIGDTIAEATDDAARIGFYIAAGQNKAELDALINEVSQNVQIRCTESSREGGSHA